MCFLESDRPTNSWPGSALSPLLGGCLYVPYVKRPQVITAGCYRLGVRSRISCCGNCTAGGDDHGNDDQRRHDAKRTQEFAHFSFSLQVQLYCPQAVRPAGTGAVGSTRHPGWSSNSRAVVVTQARHYYNTYTHPGAYAACQLRVDVLDHAWCPLGLDRAHQAVCDRRRMFGVPWLHPAATRPSPEGFRSPPGRAPQ